MSVLGMLTLSWRPYRFCPECGFPVGKNSRRGTLGCHAGRDRHSLCDGRLAVWSALPVPTREQWLAYWRAVEHRRVSA
jgi:hypothetical protein